MTLDVTVGGAASDSYGTLVEAAAYMTSFGWTEWAALDDTQRESALRRAAVWLDGEFSERWPGSRVSAAQARSWPRSGAVDIDGFAVDSSGIPAEIKSAQFEAAVVEAISPRSLSPSFTAASAVRSERVGPILVEYAIPDRVTTDSMSPVLVSVERILSRLVTDRDCDIPAIMVV